MLADPVTCINGIGPARAGILRNVGIETVEDLLLHLPFRYEDRSALMPVGAATPGRAGAFDVRVERCRRLGRGRRGRRVEATVRDESDRLRVVWFNQPYIADQVHERDRLLLFGTVSEHDGDLQLVNPAFEKVEIAAGADPTGVHIGRLVPIYRRIGALTPGMLRRLIAAALDELCRVEETLPEATRAALGGIGRARALREIHLPPRGADADAYNAGRSPAHRRLVCEEFLLFQAAVLRQRPGATESGRRRPPMRPEPDLLEGIVGALPFRLTAGQRRALDDIVSDLASAEPMHRLLHGDVGCGKTAVAGCALLLAAACGYQAALMAPTEILARQHADSLAPWAEGLDVELACLTGSTSAAERRRILRQLAAGRVALLVGTHALIEPDVRFARLRFVVVDEQHRFGVRQRAALRRKGDRGGVAADLLVMTATPIPRTLALTVYGDLDVSAIEDMPPGRAETTSEVVPASKWRRVLNLLRETVKRGEQAYVVAPRIEAGDDELAAAVRLRQDLSRQLPGVRVGLLHGAQRSEEKNDVMTAFVDGRVDILAATTVIEVGVDVPNATLMVVGHAESFGLAQLHQLRGRVGRGEVPSTCLFIAHEPISQVAARRLAAIRATRDGFVVAEKDLRLRGPGEVLGTRQAGFAGLRVGDPFRDHDWLELTRPEAARLAFADDDESAAFRQRAQALWERRAANVGAG